MHGQESRTVAGEGVQGCPLVDIMKPARRVLGTANSALYNGLYDYKSVTFAGLICEMDAMYHV